MFLLLGYSPWVLLIALFICIIYTVFVQLEYYGWSTFTVIGSVILIQFVLKFDLWEYIKTNPSDTILALAFYLVFGILWSFGKWSAFLYDFKEYRKKILVKYSDYREDTLRKENERRIKLGWKPFEEGSAEAEGCINISKSTFMGTEYYKHTCVLRAPLFKDYKVHIVAWVIFWIPSLIGTLLNDFVRKIVTWIVNRFRILYQTLSNNIVGDYKE